MVSGLSILFMSLTVLLCILLPVILTIYFYRKHRISIAAVFTGALTFFVFQVITRLPLISLLSTQPWYVSFSYNTILFSLALGLSAGLFEEIGRFLGYRLLLKKRLEWKNGIALGIGHGGIEAILIVGLTNINNLVFSFMINSGVFDTYIAPALPSGAAETVKSQLVNTSPYLFAAAGIERVFAMVLHIAFSIIVLYGVMNKKFRYVVYAILLHALVNVPLPILSRAGVNLWVIELYIFITAALAFIFLMKSKKLFDSFHLPDA
jgi:uncharacterized membrane protein YhfC